MKQHTIVPGILLLTTPVVALARDVFDPRELLRMLARHRRRIRREQPVEPVGVASCWACGEYAPTRNNNIGVYGWFSRDTVVSGIVLVEVYCPGCFARWGWPSAA